MPSSETKWLGGFTSADGSISATVKKQKDTMIGYHLSLRAHWSQRPILAGFFDGDATITSFIKHRRGGYELGIGTQIGNKCCLIIDEVSGILTNLEIEHTQARSKRDGMNYINVNKRSQVEKLLRLIQPYLLGSKRLQAEIVLNEIIPRMKKNLHLTREGLLDIMSFVDKLNEYKGGLRGKYNRDYFIKEWIKK